MISNISEKNELVEQSKNMLNRCVSMPEKVAALEHQLLLMPQAQVKTEHSFRPGIYERTLTIPPRTVLTGAAHRVGYHVRLVKGSLAVTKDDHVEILTAPMEFDVEPGPGRAGVVFDEEVIWIDTYENPDDCQDIKTLEDRLCVIPEYGVIASRTAEQQSIIDSMKVRAGLLPKGDL